MTKTRIRDNRNRKGGGNHPGTEVEGEATRMALVGLQRRRDLVRPVALANLLCRILHPRRVECMYCISVAVARHAIGREKTESSVIGNMMIQSQQKIRNGLRSTNLQSLVGIPPQAGDVRQHLRAAQGHVVVVKTKRKRKSAAGA